MPTGTGKTGVIGVLCVAAPPEGWSLILTPWKHLCVQMIDDLKERFWKARDWSPTEVPKIERLYPKNLATVLEKSGKWILVHEPVKKPGMSDCFLSRRAISKNSSA